ncbi:helix-turn-helix domain-containing protein [Moellerella wisconsensis]|uniref:helix-turn-helix domain-containing protein n=1 Tax=Moellerella wisconsensis TaxID=158849 RepID=UPI001F4EB069|nr:helix-turn-helix domain-containing protein [Moellerella wisconsensis]UNH25250.1 helix-turn-helix domain-containing protein [Moellerella wisconsensis]
MDLNDEPLTTKGASLLLKCSEREVRRLIKNGDLQASQRRMKDKDGREIIGRYRLLKSDCLAYAISIHENNLVNAGCHIKSRERFKSCQSNYGTASGTVISFRQAASELDKALGQQRKN